MKPTVFSADMIPLRLGCRIGKGAEGEVYAIDSPGDQVVKIYTVADTKSREAKVRKMIADGLAQATPLIAFPLALIRDQSGAFAGFTMRRVAGHQHLHELYAPGARKAAFPKADYRFLVRAATNVARAVGSAHNNRCVIGDINHSGILISDQAKAALIDADSFQIMDGAVRHACKVGTLEYTPPELQGRSLDIILRTEDHDSFGLAVIIFQLLWMGRHPFSGKFSGGEMPLEELITEFRFAYSGRATGMAPPPAVPSLRDFPLSLSAAFEQSFGPQGALQRPSPRQWIALLQDFEKSLIKCERNALHYHPSQTSACPWCRMERLSGVQLFLPVLATFAPSGAFTPIGVDVVAIWRSIEAVQRPPNEQLSPKLSGVPVAAPSREAKVARWARLPRRLLGIALIGVAAVAGVTYPTYFIFALVVAGFGLDRLFAKPDSYRSFERRYQEIEARWLEAEQAWRTRAEASEFDALRNRLVTLKVEFDDLASEESRRIREYEANRRSRQLRAYLEGFLIRRTKITNVGPTKQAVLTSYGIETAADVSSASVQSVPGFGPVNSLPLIEWRQKLEHGFVYDPKSTYADADAVNRIRAEIKSRAAQIKAELASGPERLRNITQQIMETRSSIDPNLQTLSNRRAEALADLAYLGISPPTVILPALTTVNAAARPTPIAQGKQSTRCPRCGGPMISRTARRGNNPGSRFLGCVRYPTCNGTRPIS
jgi:DNA-binding helix-hairpin-helix protein with protein kinase domain